MVSQTRDYLAEYQTSRGADVDSSVLCHAPFASLNFDQQGRAKACCYNFETILGTFPARTLREIWEGAAAAGLREAFAQGREAPGCDLCFHQLRSRNFAGALMRGYDHLGIGAHHSAELLPEWPREMRFEISNVCNLECVMCEGNWSSSIRKNRERLPPLPNPYGPEFIEQLEPFVPHLYAARFLGGEPFLIRAYYEIWDLLVRVNPAVEVHITTNATVLSERARQVLEELRCNIAVSLDALGKESFEAIRLNADHGQVMENLEYLVEMTRRRGTNLDLAVCPMKENWQELPDLLDYCDRHELSLSFNTVVRPPEHSLAGIPLSELRQVVAELSAVDPPAGSPRQEANRDQWSGLVSQLYSWLEDKERATRHGEKLAERFSERAIAWNESLTAPLGDARLRALTRALGHGRAIEKLFIEDGQLGPELRRALHGAPLRDAATPVGLEGLLRALHHFHRFRGLPATSAPDDAAFQHQQRLLAAVAEFLVECLTESSFLPKVLQEWLTEAIESGTFAKVDEWLRGLLEFLDLWWDWAGRPPLESKEGALLSHRAWLELLRVGMVPYLQPVRIGPRRALLLNHLILRGEPNEQSESDHNGGRGSERCQVSDLDDVARLFGQFEAYANQMGLQDSPQIRRFLGRSKSIMESLTSAEPAVAEQALQHFSASSFQDVFWFIMTAADVDFVRRMGRELADPA